MPVILNKIYDVPMTFASKLIHGGPVHHCHEPLKSTEEIKNKKEKRKKERNKQTR